MTPNQEKCWQCYEQFQEDGSFNQNCPTYKKVIILMDQYPGTKCAWINLMEQDMKRLKNGNAYLIRFSIVREKCRQGIERVVT